MTKFYGTFWYFNVLDPSGFCLGCPRSLRRQLPCRPWHDSSCFWLTSPPGWRSRQRSPPRHWAQWGWRVCSSSPPRNRSRGSSCQPTRPARQWWWGLLAEEHLVLCQGLQGSFRRKLRGQAKENPEGSGALDLEYKNVLQNRVNKWLRKSLLVE